MSSCVYLCLQSTCSSPGLLDRLRADVAAHGGSGVHRDDDPALEPLLASRDLVVSEISGTLLGVLTIRESYALGIRYRVPCFRKPPGAEKASAPKLREPSDTNPSVVVPFLGSGHLCTHAYLIMSAYCIFVHTPSPSSQCSCTTRPKKHRTCTKAEPACAHAQRDKERDTQSGISTRTRTYTETLAHNTPHNTTHNIPTQHPHTTSPHNIPTQNPHTTSPHNIPTQHLHNTHGLSKVCQVLLCFDCLLEVGSKVGVAARHVLWMW